MEKIGGCGGDEDLPPPRYVIEILLWLPVVSLLRFKSVCKSWRALIESSFFIDLHTATTFNPSSSSSSKFGSFILHAAVRSFFPISASEHALFMVSSVSDDDSEESGSARCWWSTTSCWMSIVVTKTCSLRSDDLVLKIKMVDDGLGYVWKIQSDDGFYEDRVFKVVEDDDLLLKIKMVNGCVGYVWKIKSDDDCYDDRVFKVVEDGLGGGGGGESIDQLVLKLDKLGFPSCYKFNNRYNNDQVKEKVIAGSCNGLVCLHDLENSSINRETQEFYLCNPATGQGRILPKPITIDRDPGNHNLVAFGFDVQTQDYKVVLLTVLCPRWNGDGPSSECFCRVQVYSLSTDSWKILESIPCLPGYPFINSKNYCQGELYLNGRCFFLAHFLYSKKIPCLPVNDRFIISFDFTKEIITPIQLPDHHPNQRLYLCYMGDNKIALFIVLSVYQDGKPISYDEKPISEDFNVWVLNEHGNSSSSSLNKGSWTKLHSFQIEIKRATISYIPRGISNDGKFALLETGYSFGLGKKMILYNLVTKEMKRNFLSCGEVMSKAHPYKPSLVSVIGGYGAQQQQHADRVI